MQNMQKWYVLSITGSLSKVNNYVRNYSENSEKGGIILNRSAEQSEKASVQNLNMDLPNLASSFSMTAKLRRKKSFLRSKSRSRLVVPEEEERQNYGCRNGVCYKVKPKMDPDNTIMKKVIIESRNLELKDYYRNMIAVERSRRLHQLLNECPYCGLQKRDPAKELDITHNIYCHGSDRLYPLNCAQH